MSDGDNVSTLPPPGELDGGGSSADSNLFTDYELLTSSEYLLEISPSTTKLVEIIGIIHLMKAPELVKLKNGDESIVCNFFIANLDGDTVQCVMWGETIEKFIDKLIVHHVIHIDGAFPKAVKDQFNAGSVPYELIIQSNTTVTDLGKMKFPQSSKGSQPELVPLTEVCNHKKIIAVRGFIKTPWAVIHKQTDSTGNTCYGSIAADKYFLDVKISDFPDDYSCQFKKGQHVQCTGSVVRTGTCLFFCVQAPRCITLVDDVVASLKELLVCRPVLSLTQLEGNKSESNKPSKKMKMVELFNRKYNKKD